MDDRDRQSDQMSAMSGASSAWLRAITILECASNVFRVLMNDVGVNRTLEAIRPYSNFYGLALVDIAKEKFGLKGNDAEAVALPYYWLHCGSSSGNCKPMEIREGGAIVELNFCPITLVDAPPEICVSMSHFVSEGVCEAVNPAYEYVFTHHLGNHDKCCRYVVRKKSSTTSLDNLGRLQKTVPVFKLSQEEMESIWEMITFGYLNIFTSASLDVIGPDRTLQLVAPFSRNVGLKLGSKLISGPGEKNNLFVTRDKLDFLCSVLKQNGTPAVIVNSEIEKEITECPFKNGAYEVCKHLEGVLNGVCETINPAYEFAYDKMMTRGDNSCHWIVKKRPEVSAQEEATKKSSEIEEMLKALKWRLARGEITEPEYDRLRGILSE